MEGVPPEKLEAEVKRLEGELATLRREWDLAPRLLGTVVLALPMGLWLGPLAAFLTAIAALSLVAVTLYLVGFRIRETRDEIALIERTLGR